MATILTPTYAVIGGLTLSYVEDSSVTWTMQSISGWGAPRGTLTPIQKPRQAGAWAGDSFSAGRSIVIAGTVYAPTPALALDALDRLVVAASLAATVLTVVESGRSRFMSVRRDGDVIETWLNQQAFTYSVQFFAPDPRKFGTALTASTGEFSTTGGLTVPFTVPFTINSTISSGLITLTNPGNEVGPVVARVDGPCRGLIITHTGSSGSQVFSMTGLNLVAGEWLVIDMEKRTVLGNGTASRSGFITSRVWSGFDVGVNTCAFSAVSFDAGALLTITATPANK